MSKKIFFITGTGTDVGKTIATAGIAGLCVSSKMTTAAMKPIQTGSSEYEGDIATIKKIVAGLYPLPPKLECPYTFPFPASPHLAARVAGQKIEPEKILGAIEKIRAIDEIDALLIEAAGGLLVPINGSYTNLDLIKDAKTPAILVASAGLGTINHTLLSVNALKNANIEIAGIIINKMPKAPKMIEKDNLIIIEELSEIPILAVIEETDDFGPMLLSQFETEKLRQLLLS